MLSMLPKAEGAMLCASGHILAGEPGPDWAACLSVVRIDT